MKFGENLKLIRKSNNISQEYLAEKLGVSRQSVSKWETGENYPSMTNILCLCDIFKCKINELVHEDFVDINFLDDEIKVSVVKFKEKEQTKMKVLSKIIYILAKIGKTISIIGIVGALCALLAGIILFNNMNINEDNTINITNHVLKVNVSDNEIKIYNNKDTEVFNYNGKDKNKVEQFLKESKLYKISLTTVITLSLSLSCFFLFKMLSYIEKLFVNIHENDTPFNKDNVRSIKNIALYLILAVLIPDLFGNLAQIIFNLNLEVEINMIEYIFAIIIFSLAYIFQYGYEIQLDSKGRMYGKTNE